MFNYHDLNFLLVCLLNLGYTAQLPQLVAKLSSPTALKLKAKVGVLCPVQQPGSYWDSSSALPLVGLKPTEVTAYD